MINILYYSPRSVLTALLASIRHCHPHLPPEHARARAKGWLRANYRPHRPLPFMALYSRSPEGDTVWLMTAGVPLPLLGRTLNSFPGWVQGSQGAGWILHESPLPAPTGGWGAAVPGASACWRELGVQVEQTRLQAELVRQK